MLKQLARMCFKRDDWKCRCCGNRQGLHPHHIKFASQGGEDVLDNLITVCWICHRLIHEGKLEVRVCINSIEFWRKP